MNKLLTVNQLTKSYEKSKVAVKGASFEIHSGECLGLVGESGCGKSTLARCLLRIEPIDSGEIRLQNTNLEKLNNRQLVPFRRHFQAVFQNPMASLNPKLKIKESLVDPYLQFQEDLSLKYFSYTSKNAFVKQLLEAVELTNDLAERYPHELSGGQRQRVTIARAISIEPDLIVLDESTASLDVLTQGSILELLAELQKNLSLSYLFISHDLAAVRQMSQRILVMREGELVDEFNRDELFGEDRHPYTKELISIF